MIAGRDRRVVLLAVFAIMLLLQFYVRPRLWDGRLAPDFLLIALLAYAMVSRPGAAAVAGLIVGLIADVFTPAQLGAGMLAHVLVAYLASWSRVIFFAENYLVRAGTFFVGCWLRNLLVVLLSGLGAGALVSEALVHGPIQAVSTAIAGALLLFALREWLDVRLEA